MPGAGEFDAYVAARQRRLVRTAYLLTGNHHEAEDLVQSALAQTYRAWQRIRDPAAVDGYVYRAMVNLYRSWWRRAWRRYETSTGSVPERPVTDPDPAEQDEVWRLVETLPPRQRAAIVLRFYADFTPTEIAGALNCSTGTVASQASRALATLRDRLAGTTGPGGRSTGGGVPADAADQLQEGPHGS